MFKKPKREINKVYIHCSASDVKAHDNIDTIREWHILPRARGGRGYSDVGYHYFITKNGGIQEGRTLEKTPATQKGNNTGSIAICLSGKHIDLFTQSQFDTLKNLCEEINQSYYKITFHGHCEVSKKTCPVFDYKRVLSLDEGYMPLTILPTIKKKKKKKMSISLLLLTPLLKKLAIKGFDKLKGKVLDKAKKTVIKKILEKTGINLNNTLLSEQEAKSKVDQVINRLSSEQLLELKKEIIESESELLKVEFENQTEQMSIINKTMRAEMKSESWIVRFWRPLNGILFGISMFSLIMGSVILNAYAIIITNVKIPPMISEVNQSLMAALSLWAMIIGGQAIGRSFEKYQKLKKSEF